MILEEQVNQLTRDGVEDQAVAKIKCTPKAFDLMAVRPYSRKIEAVLRELLTNAVDAHVEAGKPEAPVTLVLPNELHPYVEVRDEGVGMALEQLLDHYMTFFESSKDRRNDVTGAFGIGRWAAFAYAEQFTVDAVKAGRRARAVFYRTEDRGIAVNVLADEPTDAPDSFAVKIAVDRKDFNEFRTTAANLLRWFTVRPVVKGAGEDFEVKDPGYTFRDEGPGPVWGLRGCIYNDAGITVVSGNIAYPFKLSSDDLYSLPAARRRQYEIAGKHRAVLHLPLGSVQPALGREQLEITKGTRENVFGALEAMFDGLAGQVSRRLGRCESAWEAACAVEELRNDSLPGEILDQLDLSWGGRPLPNRFMAPETIAVRKVYLNENWIFKSSEYASGLEPGPGVEIHVRDLATGFLQRFRKALNGHRRKKQHHFGRGYVTTGKMLYVLETGDRGAVEEGTPGGEGVWKWLRENNLDAIAKKASDLPAPEKPPAAATPSYSAPTVKVLGFRESGCAEGSWHEADLEREAYEKGGLYVDVYRFGWSAGDLCGPASNKEKAPQDALRGLVSALNLAGQDITLYGMRQEQREKAANHPKWRRLDDFVAEQLENLKGQKKALADFVAWQVVNQHETRRYKDIDLAGPQAYDRRTEGMNDLLRGIERELCHGDWEPARKTKPMNALLECRRRLRQEDNAEVRLLRNLLVNLSEEERAAYLYTTFRDQVARQVKKHDELCLEVLNTYPLIKAQLERRGSYYGDDVVAAMLEYVDLMDRRRPAGTARTAPPESDATPVDPPASPPAETAELAAA